MDELLSDFLDIPETPTSSRPFDFDLAPGAWPSATSDRGVGAAGWELAGPGTGVNGHDDAFGFAISNGSSSDQDDATWLTRATEDDLSSCGIELGEIAPLPGSQPLPQPASVSPDIYAFAANGGSPGPYDFLPHDGNPYQPSTSYAPPPPPASSSSRSFDSPSPSSASSMSLPPATPPPGWAAGSALTPAVLAGDCIGPTIKRARSEDSDTSTVNGGSVDPYALFLAPAPGIVSTEGRAPLPPAPNSTSPSSSSSTAAVKPPKKELTGTGKKRKSLPTVAEFQPPSTDGLTKKEARLVKNRAAAFLSRQRKREMYDELEIEVGKLRAELAQLKGEGGSAAATPASSAELDAVKADLAHVRSLLHASTARERALEVELASLRARHGPSSAGTTSAVPPPAHAVVHPHHQQILQQQVGPGPMVSGFGGDGLADRGQHQSAHIGGRRAVGAGADRDSKRIGGVALMVIMFSFALFSFPSTALSSLPLRLTPTQGAHGTSSPFPAFLGRVLSASTGVAGGVPRFANVTIAKDTGGGPICLARDKSKLKASAPDAQAPANATKSAVDEKMECDAPASSPVSPSIPSGSLAVQRDVAWPLPDDDGTEDQSTARRSLSLTLLRPVPVSVADLAERSSTYQDDDVDDVLSRWLGLSLDDDAAAAVAGDFGLLRSSPVMPSAGGSRPEAVVPSNPTAEDGADSRGWLLIGPGQSVDLHRLAETDSADVTAWDGTTLERMELDDVLSPGLPTTEVPSLAALDAESRALASARTISDNLRPTKPLYRRASTAQPSHLYTLGLPPPGPSVPAGSSATAADVNATVSESLSGQYLRLDLSLDLSVRKTAASLIGADELGRLLALSGAAGSSGATAKGTSLSRFDDSLGFGFAG